VHLKVGPDAFMRPNVVNLVKPLAACAAVQWHTMGQWRVQAYRAITASTFTAAGSMSADAPGTRGATKRMFGFRKFCAVRIVATF
jgi:hypothetical protein